jgi:hypothetical protein
MTVTAGKASNRSPAEKRKERKKNKDSHPENSYIQGV